MLKRAQDLNASLVEMRRDLHSFPELAFREHRTAQKVAERLTELGIAVKSHVGITGVVGDLGDRGPCIALRADMDALPIQEENDVPYASRTPGVMHACGHEVHVACLLGAAQILAEEYAAGRLPCRVRFLFQPSEESQDEEQLSGAMRMVNEGAMDGVDAVVALHVWGDVTVGSMSVRTGTAMARPDKFRLTILGQEAHGAFPHRGFDAITLSAQVINALQTVVSRRLDPTLAKVLTIGTIQGGTKENIIAGSVFMAGTIRTFDSTLRADLIAEMERACGVARALGGDFRLEIIPGYLPVVNDTALTQLVRDVGARILGPECVLESPLEMGGEDFSYFAQKAPGCFFQIGAAFPGEPKRLHHHPRFDVDERCLPIGTAMLAEIVRQWALGASTG